MPPVVLRRGREVLDQVRALADEPLLLTETDPLSLLYRDATVMTDMVVRTVQAFPETPSVQLRLCDGLEVVLDVVAERLAILRTGLQQRQGEDDCLNALMELLGRIAAGQSLDTTPLITLADRIVAGVHKDQPLRLLYFPPDNPVKFVAGHSLNVAQVAARLTRHEPEWRNRPLDPIIAALVHDVGMLCVPPAILCHPGLLEDGPRRAVEVHANAGAEALARSLPDARPLAEAAAYHHERLDGTGYPSGLREMQIAPLVRLLSVCDVYTAQCSPRSLIAWHWIREPPLPTPCCWPSTGRWTGTRPSCCSSWPFIRRAHWSSWPTVRSAWSSRFTKAGAT